MARSQARRVLQLTGIRTLLLLTSTVACFLCANFQALAQEDGGKTPRTSVLDQLEQLEKIPQPSDSASETESADFVQSQGTRIQLAQTLANHQNSVIRRTAIKHQFDAYRLLVQQGADAALEDFGQFARSYSDDADAEIAELGERYAVIVRLQLLLDGDRDQAQSLLREFSAWLENQEFNSANIQLAMQAVSGLEKAESYRHAIALLETISHRLAESDAEIPQPTRAAIEEARQRMSLVGQRFPINGILLNGQQFTPDQLTGQVVLVDFWASWCAPCRREIPHIRKMLDRYQDQGFGVVGVCLDEERESAQQFLNQFTDVNWPNLMEEAPDLAGFNHPLAKRASVSKLPTAILLDTNGKVISIAARGKNLHRWLAEIFRDFSSRRSPFQPDGLMMTRASDPPIELQPTNRPQPQSNQ